MTVKVAFERITPDAKVPKRATTGSAAYDVYTNLTVIVPPGEVRPGMTGIRVKPPKGWCVLVLPRSGLAFKGMTLANAPGLIDSDYGGELICLLYNRSKEEFLVKSGDRIAQLLFVPAPAVTFVEKKIQGRAGFGSTGR